MKAERLVHPDPMTLQAAAGWYPPMRLILSENLIIS